MKATQFILLGVLAAAWFPVSAHAAEGDELIKQCESCHGENGISTEPTVPIIGGLSDFFIDETMYIYQDRARPCVEAEYLTGPKKGEKTDMCVLADELSEDDIAMLAEHYAELPFVPADQPFDSAQVATGAEIHDRHCEKCHAAGGSDPLDDSGLLAGQWTEYLRSSIEHFRAGERESDEKMIEKLEELTAEDVEALLNYYASLKDKYNN